MHKFLIPLTALSGLILSNCTHPAADIKADAPANQVAEKELASESKSAPMKTQDRSSANAAESAQPMASQTGNSSSIYWVKAVGTLVYNTQRQPVRSLRFQPQVKVLKNVDGWGLIDVTKDEWVKMSDLTCQKPDDVLAAPENSTGLPRVKIDVLIPDDR